MRARVGTFALAATLASASAFAADWEWNPKVEAGYLFDDNFRLTAPGTEIEVQGPVIDAALELRAVNPAGEFSFTPRVRSTYFADERELDSTDYYATLDWKHRGQRVDAGLRGEFSEQDVVNSEQPDAEVGSGLGEVDIGDGGRVLVTNRRTRYSVLPSLDFELSPRRQLQFDANYTDVTFDQEIVGAQEDYRNGSLSAGLLTNLTETSSLTVRGRGAHYEIASQGDTNSYGAELQWDSHNAADTRKYLRLGAQNVDLVSGDSQIAWVAGIGVSLALGRNELFADLSRDVGPSAAGAVVTRNALRVRWTRAMTPRLSVLAGLRGTHDEDVDSNSGFTPRSYVTGDLGLQWRWQEEFSLRLALDYTWQDFEDTGSDATSTGALVSVIYQPLQRRR